MADWSPGHNESQRGALIRLYVANPDSAPPTNVAVLDTGAGVLALNGGSAVFGPNYTATKHPTRANVNAFKLKLINNLRDYLDGIGFAFKSAIKDEEIGKLGGDKEDLTGGATEALVGGFVTSIGSIGGVDARETGVDRRMYKRDMQETAILKPDEYVKLRNADLQRIDNLTLQTFRESFKNYYDNYKYTAEEAKKMALADKQEHYNRLMKGHNAIFDIENYKQAEKRITKNV